MKHIVVLVATAWGTKRGGLNVFNTGLAYGLESILTPGSTCLCVVEDPIEAAPRESDSLRVRQYDGTENALIDIVKKYVPSGTDEMGLEISIVGHDVHTGPIAIKCAKRLSEGGRRARSVLVCHMDYKQYGAFKGHDHDDSLQRADRQRQLVSEADAVFAVGPMLSNNFQSARSNTRVHMLVPGAADIEYQTVGPSDPLRFFFSGRLNNEDDRIKNGKLVIEAIGAAYESGKPAGVNAWQSRGELILFGVDADDKSWDLNAYNAKFGGEFWTKALPYSNDQNVLFKTLRLSHLALMPSWHEGFGLAGWEAVCGAVPLICGEQSGLSLLLDKLSEEDYLLNCESVVPVKLIGVDKQGNPPSADISTVRDAILEMISHYKRRKFHAGRLAEKLKQTYTWNACAHEFASKLGITPVGPVNWVRRRSHSDSTLTGAKHLDEDYQIDVAREYATSGHALSEWAIGFHKITCKVECDQYG